MAFPDTPFPEYPNPKIGFRRQKKTLAAPSDGCCRCAWHPLTGADVAQRRLPGGSASPIGPGPPFAEAAHLMGRDMSRWGGERGSPQYSRHSPQYSRLCPRSPSVQPTDIRTTGEPLPCFRPPNIAIRRSPSTAGTRGAPRSPGSYRKKNSRQKSEYGKA